tara:strand:- start:260 stop:442 length:183 start_codon:yes stop_codon:yes gene_type:complete
MNKRGQLDELNPIAVIMGLAGGGIAIWYASLMSMGLVGKIFIGGVTAVVCYIMSSMIMNN